MYSCDLLLPHAPISVVLPPYSPWYVTLCHIRSGLDSINNSVFCFSSCLASGVEIEILFEIWNMKWMRAYKYCQLSRVKLKVKISIIWFFLIPWMTKTSYWPSWVNIKPKGGSKGSVQLRLLLQLDIKSSIGSIVLYTVYSVHTVEYGFGFCTQ